MHSHAEHGNETGGKLERKMVVAGAAGCLVPAGDDWNENKS